MTLFSARSATKVLVLSVAIAASGMTAAKAGDGQFRTGWSDTDLDGRVITRRDRRDRGDRRPGDRRKFDDRRTQRDREEPWRKDRNFYGGAFTAYNDAGNGYYFDFDGDSVGEPFYAPLAENRGPKIIEVVPGRSGCSWEAGVCVIRP